MAYKDILVVADTAKSAASRYDVAAALARAHGANLTALFVKTPPWLPPGEIYVPPHVVQTWQENVMREQEETALKILDAAQKRNRLDFQWISVKGDPVGTTLLYSRYADLAVASQSWGEPQSNVDKLDESLLMASGRPVVIVPSVGRFETVSTNVLIAWNETRESTRAVHDAIPTLKRAKTVTAFEVNPEEGGIRPKGLAAHLQLHDISVKPTTTVAEDIDVGDALLSRAADLGADLLVMGGYGHSRLREYTFGGVTRHILEHMTLPTLMSH
ncbi:MAG TPA: universal stress protein [Alphaproteobacteria bacterium]